MMNALIHPANYHIFYHNFLAPVTLQLKNPAYSTEDLVLWERGLQAFGHPMYWAKQLQPRELWQQLERELKRTSIEQEVWVHRPWLEVYESEQALELSLKTFLEHLKLQWPLLQRQHVLYLQEMQLNMEQYLAQWLSWRLQKNAKVEQVLVECWQGKRPTEWMIGTALGGQLKPHWWQQWQQEWEWETGQPICLILKK